MTKQESLDKIVNTLSELKAHEISYIIKQLEFELLTRCVKKSKKL